MTVTRATMRVVDMPLADGVYDAFIVWAEERDDGAIALDLTITTGVHKGEVVSVRATDAPQDATGERATKKPPLTRGNARTRP
jgi:hypothetical protein